MQLKTLFLILIPLAIFSCGQVDPNKQIDEGNVTGEIYQSNEIGWTIEIPKGWTIISKDKAEANDQKGKDAIEKVSKTEIDTKTLKHLISFQKNQFNIFASTSEPFTEDFPGEYEQNNRALNELIYEAYINQGIRTDSSSGKETIQGLEFHTFYTTIYAPDGKVILHQILHSRLINGFDFGVNINYNNEEDKKTMVDAWENSMFDKK
ncbi:MAG TPA: hypothetical protein VE978_27325 [Chitinophagales bacterium]|nr:hypothetical protein [Chitinophagales bacterium]